MPRKTDQQDKPRVAVKGHAMRYVIATLLLLFASRAAADDQACETARQTLAAENATNRQIHEQGKALSDENIDICDARLRAILAADVASLRKQLDDIMQVDQVCADHGSFVRSADSILPQLNALLAKGQDAIAATNRTCDPHH